MEGGSWDENAATAEGVTEERGATTEKGYKKRSARRVVRVRGVEQRAAKRLKLAKRDEAEWRNQRRQQRLTMCCGERETHTCVQSATVRKRSRWKREKRGERVTPAGRRRTALGKVRVVVCCFVGLRMKCLLCAVLR